MDLPALPEDWRVTPLGAPEGWPEPLRAAASLATASALPTVVAWGAALVCLCNEAFVAARSDGPDATGHALHDVVTADPARLQSAIDAARTGHATLLRDLGLARQEPVGAELPRLDCQVTPLVDGAASSGVLLTWTAAVPEPGGNAPWNAASEPRYKTMAEALPHLVWSSRDRGRWEYASRQWCAYTGQTAEEACGRGWFAAVHEDERALTLDGWTRAETNGRYDVDHRLRRHDGVYRWFQSVGARLQVDGGDGEGHWVGACTDVDDLRRSQDRLRDSEARLRLVIDGARDYAVIAIDPDHRITSWSVGAEIMFGSDSDRMTGRLADEIFTPEDRAAGQLDREMALALETGCALDERWHQRADGSRFFMSGTLRPLRSEHDGQAPGFLKVARDETGRRAQAEALARLNETLERRVEEALAERALWVDVFESTDALIAVVRPDGRFAAVNRPFATAFERRFGVVPKVGDVVAALLPEAHPDREAALQAWRRALAGEAFTVADDFEPNGTLPCYERRYDQLRDAKGRMIGASHYAVDVTDRMVSQARLVEAEAALQQSQKMEALGQITGGVAHDFNNLLTPIFGSLDMLQRRRVGDERERRLVTRALQAAERAKTLVQRLLAFARRQPLQPAAVDVAALVHGMTDILASSAGPAIRIVVDAPPQLPAALADANQLEMAILNLAVNARDAMPEGGALRIALAAATVGARHPTHLSPGAYVRLSVVDTGVGMDAATLARAIEPFFSTKGIGQGTGLGLSMVHGLATQLGGALTITSSPGQGTRIDLFLPLASGPVADPTAEPSGVDPERHDGTVLLVDDEAIVRQSTADMLTDLGYDVVETESAEDALRYIDAGEPFDLLVTDHLMPGMNGTELARIVRDRWPERPVLIISGFAEVEGIAVDLPRLTKPFRRSELANMLLGR